MDPATEDAIGFYYRASDGDAVEILALPFSAPPGYIEGWTGCADDRDPLGCDVCEEEILTSRF